MREQFILAHTLIKTDKDKINWDIGILKKTKVIEKIICLILSKAKIILKHMLI